MSVFDDVGMASVADDAYLFHTIGPNCHWCYERPTAYVWGPYRTSVCLHCEELIAAGRQCEVVEALAEKMTVRDLWFGLDPEFSLQREHERMSRWLSVRTDPRPT
jgi:hypothetical protein